MNIGVFDSGVGGKSVADAISSALPQDSVIYVEDRENVPYGTKTVDELRMLVTPIITELATKTDVIVIACNTVSTTLVHELRQIIKTPIIAMEPMVKPAAEQTNSSIIAVCATPATLRSERYKWLKDTYAKDVSVLEPDCSDWSTMIESNLVNHEVIRDRIESVCRDGADVIVLGCTHYHWIEDEIQSIADEFGTVVIQPEQAVIRQLKRVLEPLR